MALKNWDVGRIKNWVAANRDAPVFHEAIEIIDELLPEGSDLLPEGMLTKLNAKVRQLNRAVSDLGEIEMLAEDLRDIIEGRR